MQRRALISGLALIHVGAVRAQPRTTGYRIGILGLTDSDSAVADMAGPEPRNPYVNAFVLKFRQLGYVYGVDFVTEPRGSTGNPERLRAMAAELVQLRMDVIVAPGPTLPALKQATS